MALLKQKYPGQMDFPRQGSCTRKTCVGPVLLGFKNIHFLTTPGYEIGW